MTLLTAMYDGKGYAINHIKSADMTFEISDVPELNIVTVNRENNPAYTFLNEETLIHAGGHNWRVKIVQERTKYKTVKALHSIIDLDNIPFERNMTGTYTANLLIGNILNGTGYTFNSITTMFPDGVSVENFGLTTVWKAFLEAIKLLGAEFTVHPGKVIEIRKMLSSDRGQQLRYGKNIKSLSRKTDSGSIVTKVHVFYGDDYHLNAVFTSPTAGNYPHTFSKVVKDSRIKTVEGAQKRAEKEFQDVEVSYEVNCLATNASYELGEQVWTIYEPLDDLKLQTRVLMTSFSWDGADFTLSSVAVGNAVFKTEGDIILDKIGSNKSESEEKLDEAKKSLTISFNEEITNTAANITAQYTSAIQINAQALRTEFGAQITTVKGDITTVQNNVSMLTQTAEALTATVSSHTTSIGAMGTRISSAEASITMQAGQISSKVSQTDYNGNMIASLINQTATTVSIKASKIDLIGAVMVNGSISGSTNLNISQDIYVGNNVYLAQGNNSVSKSIIFASTSRINGSYWDMSISAPRVSIGTSTSFTGVVDFSGATVIGLPVVPST